MSGIAEVLVNLGHSVTGSDLKASAVRAVILWEFGWSESRMEARKTGTMAAVPDAGATLLDQHIADNFRRIETHGEYHLLWRRDVPFPGDRTPYAER